MHKYRMLVIERSIASNHTITDDDVAESHTLRVVGTDFIVTYTGNNTFIPKLQRVDPYLLSVGQLRAALKIMIDEYKASLVKPQPPITDARYTIVINEHEYTVMIEKYEGGRYNVPQGTQSLYLLTGPDNTSNYTPVGWIYPNRVLKMGDKFKNNLPLINAVKVLLRDEDTIKYGEAYALKYRKCWRCHRDLTKAKSIIRGLGPTCAKILGIQDETYYANMSDPARRSADPDCDTCLGEGEHPDDDLAAELGINDAFYMPCFTCRRQDYDAKEARLRANLVK